MKVTKKDAIGSFKPIDITISIETPDDYIAFKNLASLDLTIPEAIKDSCNDGQKSSEIIEEFLVQLQKLKF